MSYKIETASFINDLERVAKVRSEVASCLGRMAETLDVSELEGEKHSGRLGLDRDIEDITLASKKFKAGRVSAFGFRRHETRQKHISQCLNRR